MIAFSGAFHGMTLGSLAMTTDRTSREGAGVPLDNVTFVPYDGTLDSIAYLRWILEDDHSGTEKPAAIFLETLQAEGGINVASVEWLQEIRKICTEYGILMVCDDIQVETDEREPSSLLKERELFRIWLFFQNRSADSECRWRFF